MNLKLSSCWLGLTALLWTATALTQSAAAAQATPQYSAQGTAAPASSPQSGGPVSYASVTQLNGLLEQLEATSKSTQADLSKLRLNLYDQWFLREEIGDVDNRTASISDDRTR